MTASGRSYSYWARSLAQAVAATGATVTRADGQPPIQLTEPLQLIAGDVHPSRNEPSHTLRPNSELDGVVTPSLSVLGRSGS
jgi:hypothetical protein